MASRAQGATEYLVLLAVVLIVALVSVALLGFFPGMASDAQVAQSKAYWSGMQPIAITDVNARAYSATATMPYMRLRNTGAYPIRITKVLGTGSQSIPSFYNDSVVLNLTDYFYLAPGEETYFSSNRGGTLPAGASTREIDIYIAGTGSNGISLFAASSICAPSASAPGTLVMNDFGFEYIEYVEGQQITKRKVGAKPLAAKCSY
jgi:hypothetical protein